MAANKNARMKKGGPGPSTSGWEIVYSGFVLILLCFFIMLCSFSTMETSKVTRFVKSFSIAVSVFSGGLNFNKGEVVLPVSADIIDAKSAIANIFHEISEIMKDYGVNEEVGLYIAQGGLVIRLSDTVLFDPGSADVNAKARPILNKIGTILSSTPHGIRIEGHSDNTPMQSVRFPSNWELSAARAIGVLRYFSEENHIPQERLSAEGFGEYQPVAPNDTVENRARNRRVEIKIHDLKGMGKSQEYKG